MKTVATVLGVVALALSLSSCKFLQEKYDKNQRAAAAFLTENKTGPAKTNIEGVWWSPDWGVVVFNQENGQLTGSFQDYYVIEGVVSGRKAFMNLVDDDWREYTVELAVKSHEKLVGYYSPSVPFSDKDKQPLVLTRIGN
jgi:hypothetical protein